MSSVRSFQEESCSQACRLGVGAQPRDDRGGGHDSPLHSTLHTSLTDFAPGRWWLTFHPRACCISTCSQARYPHMWGRKVFKKKKNSVGVQTVSLFYKGKIDQSLPRFLWNTEFQNGTTYLVDPVILHPWRCLLCKKSRYSLICNICKEITLL